MIIVTLLRLSIIVCCFLDLYSVRRLDQHDVCGDVATMITVFVRFFHHYLIFLCYAPAYIGTIGMPVYRLSTEVEYRSVALNFTYRYIDDVLSINSSRFAEFLPLIYPPELEVKETTDTASSASFLDLYFEFDVSTKIYDKRDDFNFNIMNFPKMCSNIPACPAYDVYISQLIRYARASSNYSGFLKRHLHLRNRLLDQGYKKIRLI